LTSLLELRLQNNKINQIAELNRIF